MTLENLLAAIIAVGIGLIFIKLIRRGLKPIILCKAEVGKKYQALTYSSDPFIKPNRVRVLEMKDGWVKYREWDANNHFLLETKKTCRVETFESRFVELEEK